MVIRMENAKRLRLGQMEAGIDEPERCGSLERGERSLRLECWRVLAEQE